MRRLRALQQPWNAMTLPTCPGTLDTGRCPVGGQRLELDGSGLRCCPFKTAFPSAGDLPSAWAGAETTSTRWRRATAHATAPPQSSREA